MTQHTHASLADVLEKDYFPMPDGAKLYLNEYEWRMVVEALRCYEAEQSLVLATEKGLTTTGQKIAADERDAVRYRWLRSDPPSHLCVRRLSLNSALGTYLDGENLDTAIDAAMSAQSDTNSEGSGK